MECWAEKGGYRLSLIESFVAQRKGDKWNEFVAVFAKEAKLAPTDVTFISAEVACANVWHIGAAEPLGQRTPSQDMMLIDEFRRQIAEQQAEIAQRQTEIVRLRGVIATLEAGPPHRLSTMVERFFPFRRQQYSSN